jgi:hypothetical protein
MRTVICECVGTGYVLAQKVTDPKSSAFAFRCQCPVGIQRFSKGIPMWSDRFRAQYKPLGGTLHARDEVTPTKMVVADAPKARPTLEPLVWG